jgi:hypothetical protein
MRKSSIILIFNSRSDSRHNSLRFEIFWLLVVVKSVSTYVPTFLFEVLWVDWACPLFMVFHRHAWSLIYIRGCSMHKVVLLHRTNSKFLFSFNSYAHMHGHVIYHQTPLHVWALDQSLAPSFPLMVEFFPYNSGWESTNLHLRCRCWIIFPKSYLDFSHPKPCRFTAWASPSNVVCRYGAFSLNSLKVDDIASTHKCI